MTWPSSRDSITADHLVWIVRLFGGGLDLLWSSGDVEVEDVSGNALGVRSGASVDVIEDSLESLPGASLTVPVSEGETRDVLDLADVLEVEVSIAPVTGGLVVIEDRVVLVLGRPTALEVGLDGQLAVLADAAGLDDAPDWTGAPVIDLRGWPFAPETVVGQRAPVLYGRPGSWQHSEVQGPVYTPGLSYTEQGWQSTVTWTPGTAQRTMGTSPALPVSREVVTFDIPHPDGGFFTVTGIARVEWLIISWLPVAATAAQVWFRAAGTEQLTGIELPVDVVYDGRGRAWSGVDLSEQEPAVREAGQWWVALSPVFLDGWQPSQGGWTAAPSGALGSLVQAVLRLSSARIDSAAVSAAVAELNDQGAIGGYVDDPISAVDWCRSRLAPFGWALQMRSHGLAPVQRWPAAAVATLELGVSAIQAGPLRITPSASTSVVVKWAISDASDVHAVTMAVDAGLHGAGAEPQIRPEDVVEAPEIWDTASAATVALVALRDRSQQIELPVEVDARSWGWLQAGDGITLTGGTHPGMYVVASSLVDTGQVRGLVLRRVPQVTLRASTQSARA